MVKKALIKSISALLLVVLILFAFPLTTISFAESEKPEIALYRKFLNDHPEYHYAGLIDLDEDGRDELLVGQYYDPQRLFDDQIVLLVVPVNGELLAYSLYTHYSPVAYDSANHALVGTTGGTDTFFDCLLTIDSNNVYQWRIGYREILEEHGGIWRGHYRYERALYRPLPEEEVTPYYGYYFRDQIRLFTEPIDETQEQEYKKWFYSLSPICLGSSDNLVRVEPSTSIETPVYVPEVMPSVSAGGQHTLLLRKDGSVACVGGNDDGQLNVGQWNNISKICAGIHNSVGLCLDGTVLATGNNRYGQSNVDAWADIRDISTQNYHTLGLKSDGTVLATGFNAWGECDTADWEYVVQVSAGQYHSVGATYYGRVLAAGDNRLGQCDVSDWYGIVAVEAGYDHTVGLTDQGRVVATGKNDRGQCNVSEWEDVIQISAGGDHTVALRSDGTVVATGNNDFGQCNVSKWHDIVSVSAGYYHTVGVRSDGSIVATGWGEKGQCDVNHLG